MHKLSCALSRPIEPRQKSVSSRVTFCDDAADDSANEHKNGRACHSLIRSNSRTSAEAAKKRSKKARCRYHLASNHCRDYYRQPRAESHQISRSFANHPGDMIFLIGLFYYNRIFRIIGAASRKLLMNIERDVELSGMTKSI